VVDQGIVSFLSELHVGILSIPREGRAPHSTPVWYRYEPDNTIWFLADPNSQKGKLLSVGTKLSFVVQSEDIPYQYVSIEGIITDVGRGDIESDLRPIARFYLGESGGDEYVSQSGETTGNRYTVGINKVMSYGVDN
tara:strand:- start:1365 stop:1775 length:411 start_codon:yes stop_codon:yes gene_type:complete